jgi:hypothetical protein
LRCELKSGIPETRGGGIPPAETQTTKLGGSKQ